MDFFAEIERATEDWKLTQGESMRYVAKYRLIVDLPFLSDENPKFKEMVPEFIECVRKNNHIPSYATSGEEGTVRIEEIKP